MKFSTLRLHAFSIAFAAVLVSGCSIPSEKTAVVVNPSYEIASPDYSGLAAQALTSWSKFDFDAWTSMMSDDVLFYFPDGDAGTRTELVGRTAVLDWWTNWKQTSGIQQMTYINHVDIPVIAKETLPYSNLTGVFVISYFSNELIYNGTPVKLRMNVTVHFNSDKLIDRVFTYYDRTKIIQAMGKNILDNESK